MSELRNYSPAIEKASHVLKEGLLGREFITAWKDIPKTLVLVHPHVTITASDVGVSDLELYGFSNVPKARPEVLQLIQTMRKSGVAVVTMEPSYLSSKYNPPQISSFPDLEIASQLHIEDRYNHTPYITDLTDFINEQGGHDKLEPSMLESYIRYPYKTKPVEVAFAFYPHQRVVILDEDGNFNGIEIPQNIVQGKVLKVGLQYIPIEPGFEAQIFVDGDPTRYHLLRLPRTDNPQMLERQKALSSEIQERIPRVIERTQILANKEIATATQNLIKFFAD